MSYSYQTERPHLFTEDGQVQFLKIRDKANELIASAGCVRMDKAIAGACGDSWQQLACLDRMVELREIVEVTRPGTCAAQFRIFTKHS